MLYVTLCYGVASVDSQICASHISCCIAEQERDSAHQVFRSAHLALWNQTGPLLGELWIVIEDLASPGVFG
jgi:hypothetical protein